MLALSECSFCLYDLRRFCGCSRPILFLHTVLYVCTLKYTVQVNTSALLSAIFAAFLSAIDEAFVPGFVENLLQRRPADPDICG